MEEIVVYALIVALALTFVVSCAGLGWAAWRLEPPKDEPPPLPPPEKIEQKGPPTFDDRLRSVGIRVASCSEIGPEQYEYVIWTNSYGHEPPVGRTDGEWRYEYLFRPKPSMLGWIIALPASHNGTWPSLNNPISESQGHGGKCSYCGSSALYRFYEVVKREPNNHASDLGLVRLKMLVDTVCAGCGLVYEWPANGDDEIFGGLYVRSPNFLELLKTLEKQAGQPLYERRLRLIEAEFEKVDSHRALLMSERDNLRRRLDPGPETGYRDALPPAKEPA